MILHLQVWQRIVFGILAITISVKSAPNEPDTWHSFGIKVIGFTAQLACAALAILG